jgi:hypothetical protein
MNPMAACSNELREMPDASPIVSEALSTPGFVRCSPKQLDIQLTWDKDKADPLPDRIPFAEGTCEC